MSWLDEIEATLPDCDERRDVISQLRQIDADWDAMQRLMVEMGFRDFVRAAYMMAKHKNIWDPEPGSVSDITSSSKERDRDAPTPL